MNGAQLLDELRARGVVVVAAGDRLKVDAPKGVITPELREILVAHKRELLVLLQRPSDLHFALDDKPVQGVPIVEPCLVGCGLPVRFYWQDGSGYAYCDHCDVHQRIETREI